MTRLEPFWRSCFDFRWLLARRETPMGRTVLHLLVLACGLAAARISVILPLVRRTIDRGAAYVEKELPEVRIEDGAASVDAPQPWTRSFEGQFQVVLDTSGATAQVDPRFSMGLVVARDRVILKQGPHQVRVFELAPVKSFTTRGPRMRGFVEKVRAWAGPVLTVSALGVSIAGLALRWVLTSAAAFAAASAIGSPIGWGETLRVAAYAATPAMYVALLGTVTSLRVFGIPTLTHLFFLAVPLWLSREGPGGSARDNGFHSGEGPGLG